MVGCTITSSAEMVMPRYFFDTENGQTIRDNSGLVLDSPQAARLEALAVLGEILRYRGPDFFRTGAFSVIVTDDRRSELIRLTASVALEPEAPCPD